MLTFPMYILAHWNFVITTGASWHSIIGNIIVWSCVLQAMLGVHMSLLFEYRVQKSMEKLEKDGQVRALGVANFNEEQLGELLARAVSPPQVLQLWASVYHPFGAQEDVNSRGGVASLAKEMGVEVVNVGLLGGWESAVFLLSQSASLFCARGHGQASVRAAHQACYLILPPHHFVL